MSLQLILFFFCCLILDLLTFNSINVDHIVCYDHTSYLLPGNSFTYSKNSDFVEHLRNNSVQRNWFNSSKRFWNSKKIPEFAEIMTRYGIAFTFNLLADSRLLDFNQTSEDFRYSYGSGVTKPQKTGTLEKDGLFATFLDVDGSWINICHSSGFIVHSPFELTSKLDRKTDLAYNKDVTVWISLEIYQDEEDLRSISPERRKCYFEDERKLKYFRVYTKKNCESECFSFLSRFLSILGLYVNYVM